MTDPASLSRSLAPSQAQQRDRNTGRDSGPSWGVVSTIRAPLRDIARFAAHHLDQGAKALHIYLDQPDPETQTFFADVRQIRLTVCDDAYWQGKPEKARRTHQLRQAFNATRCYRKCRVDWLAHIDVDEFLLPTGAISDLLASIPDTAPYARMRPAEMLAQPDPWSGPVHFKKPARACGATPAQVAAIYPGFGEYLRDGFISYSGFKNFARTGLPKIRLGIHAVLQRGARLDTGHDMGDLLVGHAHAPSWELFQKHFQFRMSQGSYAKTQQHNMMLSDVLEAILAAEGPQGLRRFYDEMCSATPRLLDRLAAHDMLVTTRLDLDEKVDRWFGPLPGAERGQTKGGG